MNEKILYIGNTKFRGSTRPFGIKELDRQKHMYIIGQTGTGKTTLLSNMIVQDIQNGEGVAVIEPHGEMADGLLDYIPEHRVQDVVYFSPSDTEFPIAFNLFDGVDRDERGLVAQSLLSIFKRVWGEDSFSDRMEYITMNTILALLEYPGATMLGITRMLTDKVFRKDVLGHVQDPTVKNFWINEFGSWSQQFQAEAAAALINKFGQFISNPIVKNVIGQTRNRVNFSHLMNQRKILIVNLSKGRTGEQNAYLLGSMLVTKIYLDTMERARLATTEREQLPPFYLYVDEFQNFASDSFAGILSEARKYKLCLIMAHQYIDQMPETVRDGVFGNVGTMITFRIGAKDSEVFEREFAPILQQQDFVNMGFGQIYLRLAVDGIPSSPFSATTTPPIPLPEFSYRDSVLQYSRELYGLPRSVVEQDINTWYQTLAANEDIEKEKQQNNQQESRNMRIHSVPTFGRPNNKQQSYLDRNPRNNSHDDNWKKNGKKNNALRRQLQNLQINQSDGVSNDTTDDIDQGPDNSKSQQKNPGGGKGRTYSSFDLIERMLNE